MKSYRNAKSFREAIEAKLRSYSIEQNFDLQRLRKQVAFDRFLCRLFYHKNNEWILKGGYGLELRYVFSRATRDVDLNFNGKHLANHPWEYAAQEILKKLVTLANLEIEDYFSFIINPPTLELENAPNGGARFLVESRLDGRTFVKFHIDVSFFEEGKNDVEILQGKDLLSFAGIPPGEFISLSKEAQLAEKIHAYTQPRENNRPNSRVKDLIDMVIILDNSSLDPEKIKHHIQLTFLKRNHTALPTSLQPPPPFWESTFKELALECSLATDISTQFKKVKDFFDPLLNNLSSTLTPAAQ